MLKRDEIHRYFLGAIVKKVPERAKLVEILMEALFMEKGAVYRRLRGEVPFSYFEAACIAEKLDIPINSLIYSDSVRIDRFDMTFIEYANLTELDYKIWEDYISLISLSKDDPNSEIAESSNILPITVYGKFDSLTRFYLFKYQYLLHGLESRVSFSDLVVPERLRQIYCTYFKESKNFANTIYIWDYMIFHYLLTDVRFFRDINLISESDSQQIKEDLLALLDYIEKIALDGCFEESQKPVFFYISDVNLDSDYSYVQINDFVMSLVRTFILNSVTSTDHSSFIKTKDWIESHKKSSTLITQSAAAYRADFFETQRKIVSEL